MQPDFSKIRNIIFDLGGVVMDLHEQATVKAFAELFNKSEDEIQAFSKESFFQEYETGKIDDPTFRAKIREEFEFTGDEEAMDAAWNAMLGPIAKSKIEVFDRLSKDHSIYVLSNTNDIHFRMIEKIFEHSSGGRSFYKIFNEVYLSQEIGHRKPELEIYQHVLNDAGITASESLFIDDKEENIIAAQKAGMQGYVFPKNDSFDKLFG